VAKTLGSLLFWLPFALAVVVMTPVVALLWCATAPFDPARRAVERLFRGIGGTAIALNPAWNFRVEGFAGAGFAEPSIVVSNHESEADIFLAVLLPFDVKYLAKEALFRIPFFGWGMWMEGDVAVDRASMRSGAVALQRCRAVLAKGVSVLIFPEGTRSRSGALQKFRDGAFRIAIEAGVPVQPYVVAGTREALLPGDWRVGKTRAVARLLPAVPTAGLAPGDAHLLAARVREQIAEARAVLRRELGLPERD
jgi:1-acyl-sn-glycerol-3-phosphate acyltransferase